MIKEAALEILESVEGLLEAMKESPQHKPELAHLLQEELDHLLVIKERSQDTNKEVAGIAPGTKVSWTDHLGAWSGTVQEVHYAKVRRVVRNIQSYNDGYGYSHEITRVGTYKDPALVITIDGGTGTPGTALKLMSQINIDELVKAD